MNTNPALLKTFMEKAMWFLRYLYEHGGSEYQARDYTSFGSYLIPAAEDPEQFHRMIEALIDTGWATYKEINTNRIGIFYVGVRLTAAGIKEAEKGLPQMPMIGLVTQHVTTGDLVVDEQINHAKRLFLEQPVTMSNMRSACETLCFVLEPLRQQLTPTFTTADVNTFFQLVNTFDIRHNNASTKNLMHEEQLEWVFYTLLNTINTYTKLKAKLNPWLVLVTLPSLIISLHYQ